MAERVSLDGVDVTLAQPDDHKADWLDFNDYVHQLEAAWLRLREDELPLNPRIVGDPGLGKTTFACAVGRKTGRELYIFQCTMDTRPEDLIITPVLTADKRIEYRASSLVTAMLRGGVAILDEANRMPERSWASMAPLMDDRQYVESETAAVKIKAHPEFRLCVTMNTDSSVYELPAYIQSRLKPKIELVNPPWEMQEQILRLKCKGVEQELLEEVFTSLKSRLEQGIADSTRDMLAFAQYAQKLQERGVARPIEVAKAQVLEKADD